MTFAGRAARRGAASGAGAGEVVSSRGAGTGGGVNRSSGPSTASVAAPVALARLGVAVLAATAPRGGTVRSAGENGSSSRPNRTTTNSSPAAGSSSRTTCPTWPAIWPADSVNITFGRRPPERLSRIPSRSVGDSPRVLVRAAAIALLRTSV